MHLSDRIKKIRKHFKLSQLSFSKELGISRGHISKLERGTAVPSEQLLKLICATWSIDENWLRTEQGQMSTGMPTKQDYKEFDEISDELIYSDYYHNMRSISDYLGFIKKEFLSIEKQALKDKNKFRIDKENLHFALIKLEIELLPYKFLELMKTIMQIVNKNEVLIDSSFVHFFDYQKLIFLSTDDCELKPEDPANKDVFKQFSKIKQSITQLQNKIDKLKNIDELD